MGHLAQVHMVMNFRRLYILIQRASNLVEQSSGAEDWRLKSAKSYNCSARRLLLRQLDTNNILAAIFLRKPHQSLGPYTCKYTAVASLQCTHQLELYLSRKTRLEPNWRPPTSP